MPLVTRWTGHEIRAFSEALRMTPLDLAHKLGVSHRIIAVRETDGEDARLRMVSQAALDTLLAQSDADVHGRFVGLLPGADGRTRSARSGDGNEPVWVDELYIDVFRSPTPTTAASWPPPDMRHRVTGKRDAASGFSTTSPW